MHLPRIFLRILPGLRRFLPALIATALFAMGLAECRAAGAGAAPPNPPIPPTATIWFHPSPSAALWPGGPVTGGSTDFLELFQENSPWQRAAAHTQAFGLTAGWIAVATDAELKAMTAFLNAHRMGIEIESPALQAEAKCGSGVEGYVPYGQSRDTFTLTYLRRLKALGAEVEFIKVDEPFYFGNVVADPRSCNFSVQKIATEVGQFVQLVHSVYPDTQVGDVEPIILSAYKPDAGTALLGWHETYKQVTGEPFPFFLADIDFTNPAWTVFVKQLEDAVHAQGMRFGIIYIGDQTDGWDGEWAGKALSRFYEYQGGVGGRPDYVLFQSWEPYPQHCLPETNTLTLTGVIDAYLNATIGPAPAN